MRYCLLDTNIVSYLFKKDSRAPLYGALIGNREPVISFVSAAELYRWPVSRNWGAKRTGEFDENVERYFVIQSNRRICRTWADVFPIKGRPVGYHDSWIAATAIASRIPLITHNRQDFEGIPGLELESIGETSRGVKGK